MNKVAEIDAQRLAEKLRSQDDFILLDVREPWELDFAKITDRRLQVTPMSRLAREGVSALPADASQKEMFVLCHHGNRSADVTRWLASQGWTNVFSVRGGIEAYARKIDPSVGSY